MGDLQQPTLQQDDRESFRLYQKVDAGRSWPVPENIMDGAQEPRV